MKVFIIGHRNADSSKVFERVASEVEKLGHKVDRSYINGSLKDDAEKFEDAYARNMRAIKNADVLIAESSEMASGTGFLISTALNQKKPVLAIYNEASKEQQSTTLKGSKNKLMTYQVYTDTDLPNIVKGFFTKVKSILDTKFILIISPEIDRYLQWASDNKRMHKAQIVRNAVEEMMSRDKDWKKVQNEI